ncbi:MAG: Unknown protein [uncultured Sulfurovum sp.]|uniref:Uncharacterized protein n=1 Tax=uncultured Sulfurovum sp. TaxID=269237 RepID=A0A6S6T1V9_9BACT|nr:MAG: Unknown protein [uncultured Sulfurovum sp.]
MLEIIDYKEVLWQKTIILIFQQS